MSDVLFVVVGTHRYRKGNTFHMVELQSMQTGTVIKAITFLSTLFLSNKELCSSYSRDEN
jgi:hypothetical protein